MFCFNFFFTCLFIQFALYLQLHSLYENLALRAALVHDMMKEMERPGDDALRRVHNLPASGHVPLLQRPRLASVNERAEKLEKKAAKKE